MSAPAPEQFEFWTLEAGGALAVSLLAVGVGAAFAAQTAKVAWMACKYTMYSLVTLFIIYPDMAAYIIRAAAGLVIQRFGPYAPKQIYAPKTDTPTAQVPPSLSRWWW